MDLAWLSVLALVVVVAISCTSRANPGVVAIVLAWGIVVCAAPLFGESLGYPTLIAGFPTELFLTLVGVTLLFTQVESNGTLARVAERAQQLCGGNVGLLPPMFFLLALAIGTAGPGNIAVAGLTAPLAMAAAQRAGISPFLMALMVGHGAIACTLSPLTAAGVVAERILSDMDLGGNRWQIYTYNAVANAGVAFSGYLIFGGWKQLRERPINPDSRHAIEAERPVSPSKLTFERRHWITLAVLAALIVAVIVAKAPIGMAAFACATIISLTRLADEREVFQRMPWSVILMVCGVSLLASLLDKTGGTRRFAELIDAVSTPVTATGVLAFVTGIVSVYSSTTGVVLPAFLPMVKSLVELQPGTDPLSLALSVLVGGNLVDMSPLSTIGALCVAASPAGVDRRTLFNQLIAWGFVLAVVGAILCWAWFSPFGVRSRMGF
jgi:di/tricarboxylate transporter